MQFFTRNSVYISKKKKVNRKAQVVPQSQTASNPLHQEEEKKDKTNTYKTNKCTRSTYTNSLFPKRSDHNAKRNEETHSFASKFLYSNFLLSDANFLLNFY